jgi:hypothetical protein
MDLLSDMRMIESLKLENLKIWAMTKKNLKGMIQMKEISIKRKRATTITIRRGNQVSIHLRILILRSCTSLDRKEESAHIMSKSTRLQEPTLSS